MKRLMTVMLSAMCALCMAGMAISGSIDSPGAPSVGSGMYTLLQIYDYLNSGVESTPVPSFQEPSAVPGSTMKTTTEIYNSLKVLFEQSEIVAADVAQGKKFICTQSGSWGIQTGLIPPTPTPIPTMTPTPWLNATTCNATSGWHWYTTNGRNACWSKTLADLISWNKGVSDNSRVTGTYTCVSGNTLQERMVAAAAGEWYKIVSDVAGTTITSSHNGSNGYSFISALAIADCVDGAKDLIDCSTGVCTDWSTTNAWLRAWAAAPGKSALPYLNDNEGSSGKNDYESACGSSPNDLPLACSTPNAFYLNHKFCGEGESQYSFVAACGGPDGWGWASGGRCHGEACASQFGCSGSSYVDTTHSFRVVVRP
ncbi:MAG: hypothetical protein NTZ78_09560 [Candidatus Aureabacteria bacterium]|nr:hypothetical protein [Candidatus Auribacterota bacterium]